MQPFLQKALVSICFSASVLIICVLGAQSESGPQIKPDPTRFDVALSFASYNFKEDVLDDASGAAFSMTYNFFLPLSLQLSYSAFNTLQAWQLGALWRFRRDKRVIPYLQGGASFIKGKEDTSANAQLTAAVTLGLNYRTKLDSSQGGYLGAGAKAYFTEKKRWFADLNFRWLFLTETDVVTSRSNTVVKRQKVDPSGFMGLFGLGFSF